MADCGIEDEGVSLAITGDRGDRATTKCAALDRGDQDVFACAAVDLFTPGAAGLADDIDALITTYSDFGPGTDRYIVLSSGTYIQFNDTGMGPGTFTSIADMVADPLTQLIA